MRPRAVSPSRLKEFLRPTFSFNGDGILSFEGPTTATDSGSMTNTNFVTMDQITHTAGSGGSGPVVKGKHPTPPQSATNTLYQRTSQRGELKPFLDATKGGFRIGGASSSEAASTINGVHPRKLWFQRKIDLPEQIRMEAMKTTKNSKRESGGGEDGEFVILSTPPKVFGGRVILGEVIRKPVTSQDREMRSSNGLMLPSTRRRLLREEVQQRQANQQLHEARMTLTALENTVSREYVPPPVPPQKSTGGRAHTAPSSKERDAITGHGIPVVQQKFHRAAMDLRPRDTLKLREM